MLKASDEAFWFGWPFRVSTTPTTWHASLRDPSVTRANNVAVNGLISILSCWKTTRMTQVCRYLCLVVWCANELTYSVGVSFSKVTYAIAPFVGLNPLRFLRDIRTFEIHRSRIPTHLFKSIVTDMDIILMQYGPPPEQLTQEARSRFSSPVRIIYFSHTPRKFTATIRFLTT